MNAPIEYPTPEIRQQRGRPPLGALAWAVAKSEQADKRLCARDRVAFARVRLAERSVPPALATAWARLGQIPLTEGLGVGVRRFALLPGASGERFLQQFGEGDPKTDIQNAWDRWAAGLLRLRGFTLDDAAEAARVLIPVTVGCRPAWRHGPRAELWKQCWRNAPFPPPPHWTHA